MAEPIEVIGRPRVRPTSIGLAVLVGIAIAAFIGFAEQPIAFGSALALLVVLWGDGLAGLWLMKQTEVTATPLRRVGSSEAQPSAMVRHLGGPATPLVRLRPLIEFDAAAPFEPTDERGTVLSYVGNHPIARSYLAYDTAVSALGLIQVTRSAHRGLDRPICRGPDMGHQKVNVPDMNAADDIGRIREYVPGDRFSRVNWPATARTTSLHVRDESPMLDEVRLVLILLPEEETAPPSFWQEPREMVKTCLSLARSIGQDVLDDGRSLRLVTTEFEGMLEAGAASSARSIDKSQPRPNENLGSVVVNDYVVDSSDLLRRLSLAEPTELVPEIEPPFMRITLSNVAVFR